jgi:predicted naringenin-chalcone synthase
LQALCELLAIAIVHYDNKLASAIALALFATGVAASVLLTAAHDRPFTGEISIGPDALLQVMPGEPAKR